MSCDENDWFPQSKFLQALTTSSSDLTAHDIGDWYHTNKSGLCSVELVCTEQEKNILSTNYSLSFLFKQVCE